MKYYFLLLTISFLTGCLLTHKDIDAKHDNTPPNKNDKILLVDASDKEINNAKGIDKTTEKNKDNDKATPNENNELSLDDLSDRKKNKQNPVTKINHHSVMEKVLQNEASLRELRGQIESINKTKKDKVDELEQGLLALIQSLDLRLAALTEEVKKQKRKNKPITEPVDSFTKAEQLFKQEKWKEAIINYEKYREKNKNGKFYKKSTLQIGLSFKKLAMYKEAKVFLREVLQSYPKSEEAKEAKKLLTEINKKN